MTATREIFRKSYQWRPSAHYKLATREPWPLCHQSNHNNSIDRLLRTHRYYLVERRALTRTPSHPRRNSHNMG
jgi:hypothetical protein